VGRTQFANNQIPANRIDPIALKVSALTRCRTPAAPAPAA
jgi:hypothetical protein